LEWIEFETEFLEHLGLQKQGFEKEVVEGKENELEKVNQGCTVIFLQDFGL
jgi:hypothetical protein